MTILTPSLCRAGRALLDWTRKDLSTASGVHERTLADYERGERSTYGTTQGKLQSALEAAGVVFLSVGRIDGVGVERKP